MLASAMARELRPRGVIVIALSPGWVKTDMGGPFAPLEPATSIANLRKLLAGLTPEHSGRFLAYDGSQIPW
jgi:NAD(P)-dependent dehydrogenase (short-subunit alcohol dehydrogenase family)